MRAIVSFLREAAVLVVGVVRPALRSVRANIGLAALSVVLAFGLWIYVTNAENPERPGRVADIPVSAVNIPSDVALAHDIQSVTVSVQVQENVFSSLTAADFEATVNLDGLAVGEYELNVDVRPLTTRGALRIIDVLPQKVPVKLSQLVSKLVPISVEVKGEPPADFAMTPAIADDEAAQVAGPQEKVDLVTQAVADFNVAGRTESIRQAVRLQPRDARGSPVEGVQVDPSQTRVTIEIKQQSFSRPMVVTPQVTGTPDPGYNVTNISVAPPIVTISGEQRLVAELVTVRTQPIDLHGADKTIVRTISLELPPSTRVLGNSTVTVTITITAASGQLLFVVPLDVTGLRDGLSIVGALPSIQVVVSGPLPALLDLNSNDIVATIDLTGKGAGKQRVDVKVAVPEGLDVKSRSPEQIDVTLEQG